MLYVILASTSSRMVSIIGTKTGKPFKSEDSANRTARRLQRNASVDYQVMVIQEVQV